MLLQNTRTRSKKLMNKFIKITDDEFFVLLKLHAMRLKNGELIIWLYSGYACYAHHMLIIGITVHTQSN